MTHLQDLPSELLTSIAQQLPSDDRRKLIKTCRRLNQVVTPTFYEEVFYWTSVDSPDNRFCTQSRIYDLKRFTSIISTSESLHSSVKSVDLRWHEANNNDNDILDCLKVLETCKLRSLHLSPADFWFSIPNLPGITLLALQCTSLGGINNVE